MDRLQKWAVSHGLTDSFHGPYETVNRVLRLVQNMERTIQNKENRIDHLSSQLRVLGSTGDSDRLPGQAHFPMEQLQEEPQ